MLGWDGKLLVLGCDGICRDVRLCDGHYSFFTYYLMVWDRKYDVCTQCMHHYPMFSFSAMARTIH